MTASVLTVRRRGTWRLASRQLIHLLEFAETALEIGLVNRVVPPSEANALARRQALKLAAKPLPALMETKRLMKKGQLAQVLAQIAEEGAAFGRLLQSPQAKEAFSAFLEKRKPDFSAL